MFLGELKNDFDRGEYLQNLLVAEATGGSGDQDDYQVLRHHFLDSPDTNPIVPSFVRTSRDLAQFWQFIKSRFVHYSERREFLWTEFRPLLDYLESGSRLPADKPISDALQRFDPDSVHRIWSRATERKNHDPEGAITAARSLLEAVCKHILDTRGTQYPENADLHLLYSLTASELNLSPDQHSERIFKQILGGCSGIVSGLGSLRNSLGDAHGHGKRSAKPSPRHAELAVNLSGSVALFLVTTYEERTAKY